MAARPGCILPEGSWEGSCLNRPAEGVICVLSAEHYCVVKEHVKPCPIYIYHLVQFYEYAVTIKSELIIINKY